MNEVRGIEYIGVGIDKLITLDLKSRGVIYKLYEEACKLLKAPLCLTAAQRILDTVKSKDNVLITTGFIVPPWQKQETDGPLGAIGLARALNMTFQATPILVTEKECVDILKEGLHAAGVDAAKVLDFPLKLEDAQNKANKIVREYAPSLVIAIEKAGRNSKGEYHTMRGLNVTQQHVKIEPLIEEARRHNILTIGIGDGGNEVGMGNIKEAIQKFVPYGRVCQCPCGGGIAAESTVDVLVTAAVSNWGGYGIEASLAYLTKTPEVLHDVEIENAILKSTIEAGAVDGVTGKAEPMVDGIPLKYNNALVAMLEAFIKLPRWQY